jgi:hypothetical protein
MSTIATTRRYAPAWLGAAAMGVANGVARRALYERRLGEAAAHQASTATLVALLAWYLRALERRRPIPDRRGALAVGASWAAATVAFEFGFGHYIAGEPWEDLLRDYDLRDGRLWSLVLAWMAIGPLVVHEELTRCPDGRA